MANKVLIVDDDRAIRDLLSRLLQRQYQVATAASGDEALQKMADFAPELVLLDIAMPGMDGYETCRRLKSGTLGSRPQVVMVSAKSSLEEQLRAFEIGADDYVVKPIDPYEMRSRVQLHFRLRDAMEHLASVKSQIQSRNSELRRLAQERTQEIIAMQDVAVFTLASVAECRDEETGQHLFRMRSYSQILAEQLAREGPYHPRIDQRFLDDLYRSSPLHDIGKVGISDKILLKPARLTPEEFEAIKQHAVIGANVLDRAVYHSPGGGFLAMASVIARFHHERFDGTGYPAGLVGEEIPLPARIVALADVFDALTSVRPYKTASSPEEARQVIENESGKHFDPVIVDAFRARFDEFVQVHHRRDDHFLLAVGAMSFLESGGTASADAN